MIESKNPAAELVETGRRLYERKYIVATEGNLSTRLPDGKIMITPADVCKGELESSDLVVCDIGGRRLEGRREQSSELLLHLTVYRHRSDVMAICHAHPLYATAFAVASVALNRPVLPEIVGTLGGIPLVKYAPPGSQQLSENIKPYLDRYDAFLLESHGVLTLGGSCDEAYHRMESVERLAGILFIAGQIGNPTLLASEETDRLLKKAGRIDIKADIENGQIG